MQIQLENQQQLSLQTVKTCVTTINFFPGWFKQQLSSQTATGMTLNVFVQIWAAVVITKRQWQNLTCLLTTTAITNNRYIIHLNVCTHVTNASPHHVFWKRYCFVQTQTPVLITYSSQLFLCIHNSQSSPQNNCPNSLWADSNSSRHHIIIASTVCVQIQIPYGTT